MHLSGDHAYSPRIGTQEHESDPLIPSVRFTDATKGPDSTSREFTDTESEITSSSLASGFIWSEVQGTRVCVRLVFFVLVLGFAALLVRGCAATSSRRHQLRAQCVDAPADGLSVSSHEGIESACRIVGEFLELWDTHNPSKMQDAANRYTEDGLQFRLAFDKTRYLEIFRENVAVKMQEYMVFRGLFTFHFTDALTVDAHHLGPPEELEISRGGVVTVKGITWLTRDWLNVLGKRGSFPESEATELENCRNCKAKEHFKLQRQLGLGWNITEITLIKIGSDAQPTSNLPGLKPFPVKCIHTPSDANSACDLLTSFFELWDSSNPDKMQQATDQFSTNDVDVRVVLDSSQYILIYRQNVGLRMKEYLVDKGLLTFHFDQDVEFVGGIERREDGKQELKVIRTGTLDMQGLSWFTKQAMQVILRHGDYPESKAVGLDNCINCKAVSHYTLTQMPGEGWKVSAMVFMKLT